MENFSEALEQARNEARPFPAVLAAAATMPARPRRAPRTPETLLPRTCDRCGRSFESARWTRRYCSSACRQAAYRKRHGSSEAIAEELTRSLR
jgi:hypothetical protein